jgi:hypothetical protein
VELDAEGRIAGIIRAGRDPRGDRGGRGHGSETDEDDEKATKTGPEHGRDLGDPP